MKAVTFLVGLLCATGCTTYDYAQNVKLVAFEDDVVPGKGIGPVKGEDCNWMILGYWIGGHPTVDQAFASARIQSKSGMGDSFGAKKEGSGDVARYLNNVVTGHDGWNAGVIAKNCLTVKGLGYK